MSKTDLSVTSTKYAKRAVMHPMIATRIQPWMASNHALSQPPTPFWLRKNQQELDRFRSDMVLPAKCFHTESVGDAIVHLNKKHCQKGSRGRVEVSGQP